MADVRPDQFISRIFAGTKGTPVVAQIRAAKAGSFARHYAWTPDFFAQRSLPGAWYFCSSTTNTVEKNGHARRRKADLAATACIVVDDVGTKVDRSRVEALLPAPSWVLMSSLPNGTAGNFQWGFILAGGEQPAGAAKLLERLADIGLTDAGAKDAAHVFRLPGSLNEKYQPPFAARLEAWAPERRYTLADLAAKLPPEHDDRVVAWLERRGMVYQHRSDGGLDITCPWAAEHTAGNDGDTSTTYWPATGGRPPGFRCLHGHCDGRDVKAMFEWIRSVDPRFKFPRPSSQTKRGASWEKLCTRTPAGAIDGANVHNILVALRHAPEWRGVLAFDQFAQRVTIRHEIPAAGEPVVRQLPRMLDDHDVTAALEWFHAQGMVARKTLLYDALLIEARDHGSFHPVRDFFDEVTAGDEPREVPSTVNADRIDPNLPTADALSLLLTVGFGADDTPLNRAIARNFVIGMVRRVLEPGCQHDHLLVLIGEQGIRKSSGLALLVGREWFTDHLPDLHNKDALIQLHGKLLIEWSEMSALKRAQIERTKAFITSRKDTFRPPYGRATVDVPRTCCFAGTSNEADFLDDASGARRFWPVECELADCEWIAANRALIWRLAVQAEAQGEDSWVTAIDLQRELEDVQADTQRRDVWEDRVMEFVTSRAVVGVNINADFIHQAVGVPIADQHNGHMQRVASILKRNGWHRERKRKRGAGQRRLWFPKAEQAS